MNHLIDRYLSPIFLLACLTLGGASAAGHFGNGLLQLLAIAAILIVTGNGRLPKLPIAAIWLLRLVALAVVINVIQLIPLPSFIWSALPGRDSVVTAFELSGTPLPWLPISMSPDSTIASLLAILPALAMILLIYSSSGYGRLYSVYIAILIACASILLGVQQRLEGPDSSLYFYEITNRGALVGFFANRNHLATLLLCALPFVAALAITPSSRADSDRKLGRRMITGCFILFLALGLVMVKSAAGWILLLPTLLAGVVIFQRGENRKLPTGSLQLAGVAVVIGIAVAIFAPIQSNDLGAKLSGMGPNERNISIVRTLGASVDYLPFGSGGGTFQRIYPGYEDSATISNEYVNHAHNDYSEALLEYGIPGGLLILGFIAWWVLNFTPVWKKASAVGSLGRAGYVAVGAVMAHSMVDYPLRTAAIVAVCAMAAALMSAPAAQEAPAWQFGRRHKPRGKRTISLAPDTTSVGAREPLGGEESASPA